MHFHTEGTGGNLLYRNGAFSVDNSCCCCQCENCCTSMTAWYSDLKFDMTAADCSPGITGQTTEVGWVANFATDQVPTASATLTCLSDAGNRRANFRLVVHMESSEPCSYDATLEVEGDCWPPDVTFTFDSGDCCGSVTLRFYAPDCPDPCYCRCDNHCMEELLELHATNASGCASVGTDAVQLTCGSPCSWSGTGCFDSSGGSLCCYTFEISGADTDNCLGDYTLRVYEGATLIYEGQDNCLDGLCFPTSLVWGPIELPCCSGGSVYITATVPP